MSAAQVFFALDRKATKEFLATALKDMDELTLKNAIFSLVSTYKPELLKNLEKEVVPAPPAVIAASTVIVESGDEMRTSTDENIKRLMKLKRIDWESAWTELRCRELEDGDSICCTEECSDRDEAIEELVEAARRGKEKRNARGRAAGRQVSEEEDSCPQPYIAPPKVRDAEKFWPFMRCKNVANALHGGWANKPPIPRNHHGLLEYIAKAGKVSVETLKKTDARHLFKDNYLVMAALGKSSRW